jgi:hypothetical protein
MQGITAQLFSDYVLLWGLVDEANFDPSTQGEDEIFWTRTSDASYSARSAYGIQFDGSIESSFPTTVWRVWAPSRCKFFMWLLLQNRVWTADRLLLREWPNNYFCSCWRNLEIAAHLFVECPELICLWNARSSFVCGMPGGKTSLARYQCVDSSTRVQPLALAPWPRNCRLVRRVNEAFRRVVGQKERCPFPCHPSVLAHLAGTKCTSI